jgi:hypothetical protein
MALKSSKKRIILRRHAESDRSIMNWYVECREKAERDASPTACMLDNNGAARTRHLALHRKVASAETADEDNLLVEK